MFMFALSLVCLIWMHLVATKMLKDKHPEDMQRIEQDKQTLFEDDNVQTTSIVGKTKEA
jgi:NNP family nitrate/nitrite transporter-like MFS transporter